MHLAYQEISTTAEATPLPPLHEVADDDGYTIFGFVNETVGLIVPYAIKQLFRREKKEESVDPVFIKVVPF